MNPLNSSIFLQVHLHNTFTHFLELSQMKSHFDKIMQKETNSYYSEILVLETLMTTYHPILHTQAKISPMGEFFIVQHPLFNGTFLTHPDNLLNISDFSAILHLSYHEIHLTDSEIQIRYRTSGLNNTDRILFTLSYSDIQSIIEENLTPPIKEP